MACAASRWYVPGEHFSQYSCPGSGALPAGQVLAQEVGDTDASPAVENIALLNSQRSHVAASRAKWRAGHRTHALWPGSSATRPVLQVRHTAPLVAPTAALALPRAHGVQDASAPDAGFQVPAGHGWQSDASARPLLAV